MKIGMKNIFISFDKEKKIQAETSSIKDMERQG